GSENAMKLTGERGSVFQWVPLPGADLGRALRQPKVLGAVLLRLARSHAGGDLKHVNDHVVHAGAVAQWLKIEIEVPVARPNGRGPLKRKLHFQYAADFAGGAGFFQHL